MESRGVIRKIDELGRIVLPKELREALQMENQNPVEIFSEGNRIVIIKHHPACIFCGGTQEVIPFCGQNVCAACRRALAQT